ncbi:MAG: OB-fold nucleic acid binding domain-containing protein, partial [Methanomicrobiales archaeon]|nr:OB-fold nucleic acid binding domain-containing protein [Methanomicrobiales archaeon]
MSFHYALVDDLITREEFDRRVAEKEEETGDLLDSHTAAMLVVGELGRSHVKIRDITRKASICSFFGKVIDADPLHDFTRPDGSPGVFARIRLGDETGQIVAVLWDERAMAAQEVSPEEVVEVIGRPNRSGALEITVLNIRPSACDIAGVSGSARPKEKEELLEPREVCVLGLEAPREYIRRDGSTATLIEGLIGDPGGTYRLVCWAPDLLTGLDIPGPVRITGLRYREGSRGRECHLDARGHIETIGEEVAVMFTTLSAVEEGDVSALRGTIIALDPPRSFLKNKEVSWMRHGTLSGDGTAIRIVFWGDKAGIPLAEGEEVAIYHAQARAGRGTRLEIHTKRETMIRPLPAPVHDLVFEGTIIPGHAGMMIDNGEEAYLLEEELPAALHL